MIDRWLGRAEVDAELRLTLALSTEGLAPAELRSRAMELGRREVMRRHRAASDQAAQ